MTLHEAVAQEVARLLESRLPASVVRYNTTIYIGNNITVLVLDEAIRVVSYFDSAQLWQYQYADPDCLEQVVDRVAALDEKARAVWGPE